MHWDPTWLRPTAPGCTGQSGCTAIGADAATLQHRYHPELSSWQRVVNATVAVRDLRRLFEDCERLRRQNSCFYHTLAATTYNVHLERDNRDKRRERLSVITAAMSMTSSSQGADWTFEMGWREAVALAVTFLVRSGGARGSPSSPSSPSRLCCW